jgi:ent-kaurene oxidase
MTDALRFHSDADMRSFAVGFHRYVRGNPLKLSDGTVLPVGTHFAMPSDSVLHDSSKLPGGGDPFDFDGFRYSRLREDPDNQNRFLFAQTDNNHLHFGHGRCACPGRFLTSVELKVLLVYLLSRYDFKYPEGEGRPENMVAEESRFPHPTARVLIRRRKDSVV